MVTKEYNPNSTSTVLKELSKLSIPDQLAVSVTVGCVTGYICVKAGKAASAVIGSSIVIGKMQWSNTTKGNKIAKSAKRYKKQGSPKNLTEPGGTHVW